VRICSRGGRIRMGACATAVYFILGVSCWLQFCNGLASLVSVDVQTNAQAIRLDGSATPAALAPESFSFGNTSAGGTTVIVRPGVIVLGMHRSGTSTLCGLVHQMGFRIGGPILQPAADNQRGFFERMDVVLQNDQFFLSQNMSYHRNAHSYDHHSSLVRFLLERDQEWFRFGRGALRFFNYRGDKDDVHKTENITYAPYLAKDPRLCITLNTWLSLIDSPHTINKVDSVTDPFSTLPLLQELPAILFIYRHPLDVATSLARRDKQLKKITDGLKMWYIYNLNAIQQSYDLCRVVVSHKNLLLQPVVELDRIYSELLYSCGVGVSRRVDEEFIEDFIDHKLLHAHTAETDTTCDDIREGSAITPPASARNTEDLVDVALYRSCMLLYCGIEDRSAFSPEFRWDYSVRD
jgi:hypothetical protein